MDLMGGKLLTLSPNTPRPSSSWLSMTPLQRRQREEA
jgi:hypothetical protein